jgi:GDSL-like lipase/acylhydrolase family protein
LNGSRRSSFLRDTLLILAISAVALLAAELVIRLSLPQEYRTTSLNGLSLGMNDTLLGHLNQPGAHVILDGPEFSVDYRVGDQGFRDEVVHAIPKPDSVLRVLLLGDSFTWGAGVEYDSIWPVVFERRCLEAGLGCDIVKAGVSGFDTRQEVLYLERLLPLYRPDLVVLAFLPNDLATNLPIAGDGTVESRQALTQDSLLVRNQGDKESSFHLISLLKRLLLANDFLYTKLYFNTDRSQYFSLPANERLRGQLEVTKQLLARALADCRSNHAAFVVLSIPQQIQVLVKARNSAPAGIDVDFIDRELSSFAHDRSFEWIAALPALAKRYRTDHTDLFFRLNGHLNREGNAAVGNYLYSNIGGRMRNSGY